MSFSRELDTLTLNFYADCKRHIVMTSPNSARLKRAGKYRARRLFRSMFEFNTLFQAFIRQMNFATILKLFKDLSPLVHFVPVKANTLEDSR